MRRSSVTITRGQPEAVRLRWIATRASSALLSAPLLAAASAWPALWPLAGAALSPWLIATRRASLLEAISLGALTGTSFGCCAAPWIPEALSALGSSRTHSLAGLVVTAAWVKAPLFAAAGAIGRSLRRSPAWVQVVGFGAAFGTGEWLVSLWSGGVPAALVGHSQLAAVGVAQLAAVGGVPLISAWLAALNAALALALVGRPRAPALAAALAASWLGTALVGLPWAMAVRPAPPERPMAVLLLVQPQIPRYARWDARAQPWILETVSSQTTAALAGGKAVDAVVWPENLLTTPLEADPHLASALEREVDAWGSPLITGLVRAPGDGDPHAYRSSVVWLEPGSGVVAALDKARAVPLLEASRPVPGYSLLAPLFGRAARWPKVREARSAAVATSPHFDASVALCYEVLFPRIVSRRRTPSSVAILNLADDSWVESPEATRQLAHWAAFRAIEQRLPLVRVAHGGWSIVVDPYGRITDELPLDRAASLRVSLAPSAPPTLPERAAILALPLAILALTARIVSALRATPGRSG